MKKRSFDDKQIANIFKEFFCNLASVLVVKLPPLTNKFGIGSVTNYYQNILDLLSSKFKFRNLILNLRLRTKVIKRREYR